MRRPGLGTALQHTIHSKETREYSCFFLRITKGMSVWKIERGIDNIPGMTYNLKWLWYM